MPNMFFFIGSVLGAWHNIKKDKRGCDMLGAILGDIIGSYYESHCVHQEDFALFNRWSTFTDDSVLNCAIAELLLTEKSWNKGWRGREKRALQYAVFIKQFVKRYPHRGYGEMFTNWVNEERYVKQKSYSNGGAMRVIPIGYAYEMLEEVLLEARLSCAYTHCHKEAIKHAEAVATTVFLANQGESKEQIKKHLKEKLSYELTFSLGQIKRGYVFDSRASYSVPPAIACFLESTNFEEAVRMAVALGGDSDTMACIAGGLAEAYDKKIPEHIVNKGLLRLDPGLREIIFNFRQQYIK